MKSLVRCLVWLTVGAAALEGTGTAQSLEDSVCGLGIYDENSELEDSRIAVDRSRSRYEAYEKIFRMIEGLWDGRAIPRMEYIKAKYDQDAARLDLERNSFMLERQAALVEQYRLICRRLQGSGSGLEQELRDAHLRYRKADCDALAKGIEVAAANLEYNREYLANILRLRKENFATDVQVVLAELDVELEEKSLADAERRASVCRADLAEMKQGASASVPSHP